MLKDFIAEHCCEYVFLKNIYSTLQETSELKNIDFCFMETVYPEKFYKNASKNTVFIITGDELMKLKLDYNLCLAVFKNYVPEDNKYSNVFPIPLGYHKNFKTIPFIPMEKRTTDIFFYGQKCCEDRENLLAFSNKIKHKYKNLKIDINFSNGFAEGLSPDNYAFKLMNSKMALCPYGTSKETFRFCEAFKSGCLVVSRDLPNNFFYKDAPFLKINNWDEIVKYFDTLKNNNELDKISNINLNFYKDKLSEVAVCKYIESNLKCLKK